MQENTISNFFTTPEARGEELVTMRAVEAAELGA